MKTLLVYVQLYASARCLYIRSCPRVSHSSTLLYSSILLSFLLLLLGTANTTFYYWDYYTITSNPFSGGKCAIRTRICRINYYLPLQYYSVLEVIGGDCVAPLATGGLRANIQLIVVLNFKIV